MSQSPFQSAMKLHQAGQIPEAEALYRQVIATQPNHPDALHLLGVIHAQRGQHPEAETLIRRAIAISPNNPEYYRNLALSMRYAGRRDDAIFNYANTLKLQPNDHATMNQLSILFAERGQFNEAIAASKAAVALKPNNVDYLLNLASAYVYTQQYELAIAEFREALRFAPRDFRLWHGLGAAYGESRQHAEALDAIDHTIQLRPDFPPAHSNRSAVLRALNRDDEALVAIRRALELDPDCPGAHNNLGALLHDKGQWIETRDAWRKAVQQEPNAPHVRWNYSRILLQLGEFDQGWEEFEWRIHIPSMRLNRNFPKPQWDGNDPAGKTILLHTEGGFGDALNFIRFVPSVTTRGGKWFLECQPPLVRLFEDLKIPNLDRIIPRGEPLPDFDCHMPLQGLMRILKIRLDTVPSKVPYLNTRPELVDFWAKRLANETKIRIGLNWAGSKPGMGDHRTRTIDAFAPLAAIEGVKFFSLQKGPEADQSPPRGMDYANYTAEMEDFADAAAFIQNLDLIISVDTSIVHLAGALAKPVWVLVPYQSDFRWLLDREDSPWYPNMRLFRQPVGIDDWDSTISKIVEALKNFRP